MRRIPALLLVLVVVFAGCAGFSPWSDSGSNRTASSTSSHASLSPPPGANDQWIFDAERLVSAHKTALQTEAYRVHVRKRANRSVRSLVWSNSTITAHVGNDRIRLRHGGDSEAIHGMSGPYRGYVGNDSTAWCLLGKGECYYLSSTQSEVQRTADGIVPRMGDVLASADFVANGTVVRNGTRLYRYKASGNSSLRDVSTLDATVLVDERGVVHDFSGTVRTTGERPGAVEFDYRYELASNPPTPPEWTADRPRLTVRKNASEFTIEHDGGERIPAGTWMTVFLSNASVGSTERVRTPKSLENGDVAHLTITDLEATKSHEYRTQANISINSPSSSEPAINHSNWTVQPGFHTKHWVVEMWGSTAKNASS